MLQKNVFEGSGGVNVVPCKAGSAVFVLLLHCIFLKANVLQGYFQLYLGSDSVSCSNLVVVGVALLGAACDFMLKYF